jgi:ABC-type multidrug transport system ATPase subunit
MTPDPATPVDVRDLTKAFGGRTAVEGVTLQVRAGEVVAVLGANAAGKSTVLRAIAGMVVPDSGSVTVAGIDVVRERTRAAALCGVVLAREDAWYPRLTGVENLEFFGAVQGLSRRAVAVAADAELAAARLEDEAHLPVSAYSRGMRARLAIARARLSDPPVLLLDEPGSGLDARSSQELIGLLRSERPDRAVLLATHSSAEVAAVADRAVVLCRGRVSDQLDGPFGEETVARVLAAAA